MKQYAHLTNISYTKPAYPGDDGGGEPVVGTVDVDDVNKLAKDGWRVVSVAWRGEEMIGVLLERDQ